MNALVLECFEDGEPRALDLDLAERLGFERPTNIRNLIERHLEELGRYGLCFMAKQSSSGGRPGNAYWLNEPQAVLICTKSDTLRSKDVTQEVIEVFMAYRRGHLMPSSTPNVDQVLVGHLVPIKQGIDRIEGNVVHLAALADRTDERLSAIEGKVTNWREGFGKDAVQFAGSACATYNNCRCIFCHALDVVDTRGRKLATGRVHHGNGNRVDVRPENCTIPCVDCHERLHNPNRHDHIPAHEALAIVNSFYRMVRLKAGQIKPPNVTAWPYQKPEQRQLPMPLPLPRIVPKGKLDKPE